MVNSSFIISAVDATDQSVAEDEMHITLVADDSAEWQQWAPTGEYYYGTDGDDEYYGSADGDIIHGGDAGNDSLHGEDGNDRIAGGIGNDLIWGGFGNDLISGGDGNDLISGNVGDDVIYGNDGNDTIFGDTEGTPDEGNDTIVGGNGNDYIIGGRGDNVVIGGVGADTIVAGSDAQGHSLVSYYDSDEGVTLYYSTAVNKILGFGGTAEGDKVEGVQALLGSMYDDDISGGFYNPFTVVYQIYGDGGNDTITGDYTNRTPKDLDFHGGSGDDTITVIHAPGGIVRGGIDNDAIYVTDSVNLTVNLGDGNDTLADVNTGAASLTSSTVTGGEGDDNIAFNSGGGVYVSGGNGQDTMQIVATPGGEMDYFVFKNATESTMEAPDLIVGFEQGEMLIDVLRMGISGIGSGATEVTISVQDGHTFIDQNVVDFRIELDGEYTLTDSDFVFYSA